MAAVPTTTPMISAKNEAADRLAAEEEDGQQRHERRTRGVDRTRQRRVDGVVHVLLQVALRIETQVLADSVEDDHRVVDGVADDRQDRGDERLVDLEVEGQQPVEHREDTDDQQGVEGQGRRGTRSPLPALEAERNVETDGDEREEHRIDGVPRHVAWRSRDRSCRPSGYRLRRSAYCGTARR